MADPISVLSKEYRGWPVSTTVAGVAVNPTADPVALAFMAPGTAPGVGDFIAAGWETDATTTPPTYYARVLVGPGGDVALAPADYMVWLKVTDSPEIPVLPIDTLTVLDAWISPGDLAVIRAHIGTATPPTDAELAGALVRLGSVNEVALEVLQGRYAGLIAGPAKWAVEGDFNLDNTENIKRLAEQIGQLRSGLGMGPTLTVHTITRADRCR